jgi:phosphoribosylaminoimidazole-succinocarboxamide synthase
VASKALTEEQVCDAKLMQYFTASCRTMTPLVEFTTKALRLKV